jgi:DNA adenine methylase
MIDRHWNDSRFHLFTREHFYHVGSTENLRHPMIEALIANFPVGARPANKTEVEQLVFMERSPEYHVKRS